MSVVINEVKEAKVKIILGSEMVIGEFYKSRNEGRIVLCIKNGNTDDMAGGKWIQLGTNEEGTSGCNANWYPLDVQFTYELQK
jgi:formylmethanofuran dehydrogenase subunit C